MFKVILFDFDGVIQNNYDQHFSLMQQKVADLTREEHRKLFEGNIIVERQKMKDRDTGFDIRTPIFETKRQAVINPDTKRVLEDLSKKFTIGIMSSATLEPVVTYLERNGIKELFSFIRGLEDGILKSEKIQKVLAEYHIEPTEAVMITDTLGDILEAAEVGVPSIGFDGGYHERERLQKGDPFTVVSNFNELAAALKKM